MRVLTSTLALTLLIVAVPAAAADDDGPICVGGPNWQPSAEETRNIESEPVPQSYRVLFENTEGCQRWGLNVPALVVWHERFGTATSASIALAYIERDYRGRIGDPDRYPAFVRKQLEAEPGDFERLGDKRDDLAFITERYLGAAEEFHDIHLLNKAEEYARPLGEVVSLLDRKYDRKQLPRPRDFDFLAPVQIEDLLWRIAVLRAEISGSGGDWREADEQLTATGPADWDRAIKVAYSGGDDFCDISDGGPGLYVEPAKAHCRSDDNYPDKVRFFVTSRMHLNLLRSGTQAIRLSDLEPLLAEQLSYFGNDDRRFRLQMAVADHFIRAAGPREGLGSFWSGLDMLEATEKLAPPYEAPGRFRRVAERWLKLWNRADSVLSERHGKSLETNHPEKFRYAAYLRSTLANLDKITFGETTP